MDAAASPTFASGEVVSLGIALGVGLLVGFERERQVDTVAGVRTFGLAGLGGGLAALLNPAGSTPWVLLAVAPPKVEFFPSNEPQYVNIFISKPIGTDIAETDRVTREIETIVDEVL
ncbi:MAG: MgtC/SapB family protein, partial [Phycisphaerales bacterium]